MLTLKVGLSEYFSFSDIQLNDQWRDHQKVVDEKKRSPNGTKVHHVKQSDSIYYT